MPGHDYFRSECDNYVYSRDLLDDLFVYLLLYIDNMLIASKNIYEINGLENQLSGEFKMKDLYATKKILGIEIHKDQNIDKLYLSQMKYLKKVLKRFGMQDCKLVSTPLIAHFRLPLSLLLEIEEEKEHM